VPWRLSAAGRRPIQVEMAALGRLAAPGWRRRLLNSRVFQRFIEALEPT